MNRHSAHKTKSASGMELLIPACHHKKKCGPKLINVNRRQPKVSNQGYAVVSSRGKYPNNIRA